MGDLATAIFTFIFSLIFEGTAAAIVSKFGGSEENRLALRNKVKVGCVVVTVASCLLLVALAQFSQKVPR
jgi:hypothetical protein